MLDWSTLSPTPRFVYGGGVTWTASLPSRPWEKRRATVGGSAVAASGVPASFVIRRDDILAVIIRFTEAQWDDLLDLVDWGQGSEEITFYPDANDASLSFAVYLHSPTAGVDFTPTLAPDFPGLLEATIELRRVDGGRWPMSYYRAL